MPQIYLYIFIMAAVSYLIRVLPLTLIEAAEKHTVFQV